MKNIPLLMAFCLAFAFALFGTLFFPALRLFAFAPFLAIVIMRSSLLSALWLSLLCGLIVDLTSAGMRFGTLALCTTLTTFLVYKQKRHFFEDKTYSLPLFTAFFSFVMSLLCLLSLYAFDKPLQLSWRFVMSDLISMPLLDALYAFLWFTCPYRLMLHFKKERLKRAITDEQ